jgi:calcineurin-like phosphoesterase family protein
MSVFFTSDTHFGHKKIIEHSHRPFASVEEMDEYIIQRWNAAVKKQDDVWHLGDFNFRSKLTTEDYFRQLNGKIHMVWGNHDDDYAKKYRHLFASHQDVKYLRLHGEKITLYHYAQRVWRNSHHGSWHLFGHSHGNLPDIGRSMDVGVDAHAFTPVPFEAIQHSMQTKGLTLHHPEVV